MRKGDAFGILLARLMSEERQIAEKCEKGKHAMTLSLRDSLGVHADALVLRETRNTVLHGNISNAATPGYKARNFDFTAALRDATGRSSDLPLEGGTPEAAHGLDTPDLGFRVPVSMALDGNTVDMGVEQVQFSENTLRYQASLDLLNRRISGLMTAIKGE